MKDKALLKAAGIVALVFGIIECLTIFGAIVGIPTIIGGNKLRSLSEMSENQIKNQKDTLLTWGIVMIFICTVSGVLSLIYYYGLENDNHTNYNKYDELEKLNNLYKDHALTKEEYEKEKERILSK